MRRVNVGLMGTWRAVTLIKSVKKKTHSIARTNIAEINIRELYLAASLILARKH